MSYDELRIETENIRRDVEALAQRIEDHYAYLDKWPYTWLFKDSRKIYKEFKDR